MVRPPGTNVYLIMLLFGLAVGYSFQRSRLCFVGAIRDALWWRLPALGRAVVVLLGASLGGVAIVQYRTGVPGNVFPVGWHTVVGGILFGVGMGLAGTCAVTSLVRAGEGAATAWVTVLGLVLGGLVGLRIQAWWISAWGMGTPVFLPERLGWPVALLAPAAFLAATYFWLGWRKGGSRHEARAGSGGGNVPGSPATGTGGPGGGPARGYGGGHTGICPFSEEPDGMGGKGGTAL